MKFDRNSDVTKNVKIIEWMKKELILSVGDVFDLIFKGVKPLDEALQDTLANIIMITYLLAKRLGISFSEIDYNLHPKVNEFVYENRQSSEALFTTSLEGKELQEWREYRKNTDQIDDAKLDAENSVHYYFYSI